jgi:hypothetical protein
MFPPIVKAHDRTTIPGGTEPLYFHDLPRSHSPCLEYLHGRNRRLVRARATIRCGRHDNFTLDCKRSLQIVFADAIVTSAWSSRRQQPAYRKRSGTFGITFRFASHFCYPLDSGCRQRLASNAAGNAINKRNPGQCRLAFANETRYSLFIEASPA